MSIRAQVLRKGSLQSRLASTIVVSAIKIESALMAVGKRLQEVAEPFVPKDTNALVETAVVRQEGSGAATTIVVGYGPIGVTWRAFSHKENRFVTRTPSEYAHWVHLLPKNHNPPQQADYLHHAMMIGMNEMRAALRAALP